MDFRYEHLNKELFDKVVAFSYSIGSGLGGPGAIIMLTRDGKEYFIGQEGFEGDWIHPANTFILWQRRLIQRIAVNGFGLVKICIRENILPERASK